MVGFSGLLFGGCLSCQHGHNNNKCSSWDGAVPRACSLTARSFPFLPLAHQIKFLPTQGQFMYKSWHPGTALSCWGRNVARNVAMFVLSCIYLCRTSSCYPEVWCSIPALAGIVGIIFVTCLLMSFPAAYQLGILVFRYWDVTLTPHNGIVCSLILFTENVLT